jgi:hypothetical protein
LPPVNAIEVIATDPQAREPPSGPGRCGRSGGRQVGPAG